MTRWWAVHKTLRGRMKVCVSFHLLECCGCCDLCVGRICECDTSSWTELEWGNWADSRFGLCHFAILIAGCVLTEFGCMFRNE